MRISWDDMKSIIRSAPKRPDLYLTLMNEEGIITCANARMLKGFKIQNPRHAPTSFLDLVHPVHINAFKKAVSEVGHNKESASVELYIKNGSYHPMKWVVSSLSPATGKRRQFFCMGYKIVDDERLKTFNNLIRKHYQLIMEGFHAVLFHNRHGELVASNQQAARIFDTTLEKLYQLKDISKLWQTEWEINDEDGIAVPFDQSPFMIAAKTGKPQKKVLHIRLENGDYRWILFNSKPLPEDETEHMSCCVISNVTDITAEKKLAAKVEERRSLINAFIRQAPNLVWIVDEKSRLIMANDAFFRQFGIDEREALDKHIGDLVPTALYDALYTKHREVLETGRSLKLIEQVKLADGSNYSSHINVFPVEGIFNKRMVGGYAVNLPNTNRVELELRKANDRLLTLNHTAANAIWEWDMQTGRIFRNEALMEMIGYQQDISKGLSWWLRRIHPKDRDRVSDKVNEATENSLHSWEEEYRFKCADGIYRHIQGKGFIIYEKGLPIKMIGSLQDISTLKDLEIQLADEKLERQREISETILRVQEKERTSIGHELHDNVNQVLSTAKLFIDLLEPADKTQKLAKTKGLMHLNDAINEIRKLSRELVTPQFKEQGLVESIDSLIEDIHFAHSLRVKLTHDLETDLLTPGKKITLFRIVQEQLKNILTHSKARRAEIFLQVKEDNIQLIIKDDGVGFDPTGTRRGIGLSNIYERAGFYNGTVEIAAAPGKGSKITVSIPAV